MVNKFSMRYSIKKCQLILLKRIDYTENIRPPDRNQKSLVKRKDQKQNSKQ